MSSGRDENWERLETRDVRIGSDLVSVCMSRWHWATLEYLETTLDMRPGDSLAELRRVLPDVPIDKGVRWWIELTFAAVRDRVDERQETNGPS